MTEDIKKDVKNSSPSKRRNLRRVLMGGGILVVLLGSGLYYITSGRYISTDNAYIKAAKILVTSEVTGTIEKVMVTDNQMVHTGDTLLEIDDRYYQISLAKAQADLIMASARIEELKASYRQKKEVIERAKLEATYAESEYNRRAALKTSISDAERKDYQQRMDLAVKNVNILSAELAQISSQLGGDDTIKTEDHPAYKAAEAALAEAKLRLEQTKIKSPVDGFVNTAPRVGDFARANAPLFTMIDTKTMWMEANFKETQLTYMQPGQNVSMEIDSYPGKELHGKVESISPGTGSEFSILPAQNATGNWVKVIQRVAVHISIDRKPEDFQLRAGMSGYAVVDTGSYHHASSEKQ